MIQRIQTVFLALVVVIAAVTFFVPIYSLHIPASGKIAEGTIVYKLTDLPLLIAPVVLTAFVAVMAIFTYKNRTRQMKMARAGMLVSALIAVTAVGFPQAFLHGISREHLGYEPGAWLLIGNIPLFLLAFFFIKKDEALVRSSDRLR